MRATWRVHPCSVRCWRIGGPATIYADDLCSECGARQPDVHAGHLGRNLAVAGALCASLELGMERGLVVGDLTPSLPAWREAVAETWQPNADGKAAP